MVPAAPYFFVAQDTYMFGSHHLQVYTNQDIKRRISKDKDTRVNEIQQLNPSGRRCWPKTKFQATTLSPTDALKSELS